MWCYKCNKITRNWTFFYITLSQDDLANFYQLNFQLIHEYNYSLTELETMIPWEREVYVGLLLQHLKEKRERQEMIEQNQKHYG